VWRVAADQRFARSTLATAVREEFGRHGTAVPHEVPEALAGGYAEYWDLTWQPLAVRLEVGRDAPPLGKVLDVLRSFLIPVLAEAAEEASADAANRPETDAVWTPESGWARREG
jgi:hypothetical protein